MTTKIIILWKTMPDCSDNFESEILDGKNKKHVKCKYCSSVILTPSTASFITFESELPLMKQTKGNQDDPDKENVSLFWEVKDMYNFQNMGFSYTVGNIKYLACADCEAGPVGYHDLSTKISYVALTRVNHTDPV